MIKTMVYNAVITENNDGNTDFSVKTFKTFESAAKFLYTQYKEIKEVNDDIEEYDVDSVEKTTDNACGSFMLEYYHYNYSAVGMVCGCTIED